MNPQPVLGCIPQSAEARARLTAATGQECVPYKGSVEGTCSRCQAGVWVGPAQQRHLASGARVVCLECAAREFAGSPVISLTPKNWGD